MIAKYLKRKKLSNGLTVLAYKDYSSQMLCVNVLYKVGAKYEYYQQTGLAHLLEHLMFGGTERYPNFDNILQQVGGESNAYTSNDITHYYMSLPPQNIETAFQLESDRMAHPPFSLKILELQKHVVIEEFKETELNQPYGDLWALLRALSYQKHPYNWCTIGKKISHIESVTLEDTNQFFQRFYVPNNAILTFSGKIEYDEVFAMADEYFGTIKKGNDVVMEIEEEPEQTEARFLEVKRHVPFDLLYKTYKMSDRRSSSYYAYDLLSDILGGGHSSRLYKYLVIEKGLCNEVNSFITGSFDQGLLIITAQPNPDIDLKEIDVEIENLLESIDEISEYELQKVKNKVESTLLFADYKIEEKASAMTIAEAIFQAEFLDQEKKYYFGVTADDIITLLKTKLIPKRCSTLYYRTDTES